MAQHLPVIGSVAGEEVHVGRFGRKMKQQKVFELPNRVGELT